MNDEKPKTVLKTKEYPINFLRQSEQFFQGEF